MIRRAASVLVLVAVHVVGAARAEDLPDLLPLPQVDVSRMEADVQELLIGVRSRVEAIMARPEPDRDELAIAYGELGRAALSYVLLELPEPCFRNAERLEPGEFKWLYYLGVFYQDQRTLDKARSAYERALSQRPQNRPAALRLGQVLLLQGALEEAEQRFNSVRGDEGWESAALYGLGRVDAARGDHARAVERFEAAADQQPDAREIRQQLGLAYRELGDLDAARQHLSQEVAGKLWFQDPLVESLEHDFARGSVYLGLVAGTLGRWNEAVRHYGEAVEDEPEDPILHLALADALEKTGDLERAVRERAEAVRLDPEDAMTRVLYASTLSRLGGLNEEVVQSYRKAVELGPELVEAHLGLANALLGLERWDEAVTAFSAVLEVAPDDRRPRLRRARALIHLGRLEEAEEELQWLLARDPEDPDALIALGQTLWRAGQAERAEVSLKRALELEIGEPQRAAIEVELGTIEVSRGQLESALGRYQSAVGLAPESVEAQAGLGRVLAALGRHQEAIKAYDRALVMDPESAELRLARSEALAASGSNFEAKAELERLLESSPGEVEAVLDLAALLARLGDVDGALARLAEALSGEQEWQDKDRALLAFNAAVLRQQQGEASKAIELYRQAVGSAPEFKDAHFNLAVALADAGRRSEAVEHLERVVGIDPNDSQAHRLLVAALFGEGRFAEGRAVLERAHESLPDDLEVTQMLVQVLVASPDVAVRDLAAAAPLAAALAEAQPSLQNAAMAAAALAGTGRFAEAARWQERAVAEAEREGLPAEQLARLRQELASLRQRSGG